MGKKIFTILCWSYWTFTVWWCLYFQVEDRRVEAEKKLISLQVRVETLKEKYNVEKQQNHKYKVQEYGYDKCNNNLSQINPIALRLEFWPFWVQ